jgi:hypothetical protein
MASGFFQIFTSGKSGILPVSSCNGKILTQNGKCKFQRKYGLFIPVFCDKIHDDNICTLGATMKYLSLLVWVTQFGFSVLFPVCFFLMIAFWLQQKFALGIWIVAVLGVLGLLTSFSTAKSCLRSLLKEMDRASDRKDPPPAFNDHA